MFKRSFYGFHGFFARLHSFKSLILYSTSVASKDGTPNPLMIKYLMESVGFPENEAVSVITKSKVSHRFKSTKNSKLVVDFLKNSGFDGTQIRKVLTFVPLILHSNVEKTLIPKFKVFQELGFSGSDLGLLISQNPYVLNRSVNAHIVPALENLKLIVGSNEQLVKHMPKIRSQLLFSSNVVKFLPGNLILLQSYGVTKERIRWFFLSRPHPLLSETQRLEKILKDVEERLGIPRTSAMFLHGVHALHMTSEEKFESSLEAFRSYGWSEAQISKLLSLNPSSLTLSEKLLRVKLKYLMEDLGCGSGYLSTRPVLLAYSLEKRVVPRIAVMRILKENRLLKKDVSFSSCMCTGESVFLEQYVLPFKDKLPELYENYTRAIRPRTQPPPG